MREVVGDIWNFYDNGKQWIVIPTNGDWNRKGEAVMGRGLALDAAIRYPDIPRRLALVLMSNHGNHLTQFDDRKMFTFPVKHHWREDANLDLIYRSTNELRARIEYQNLSPVYLPRVGCGNGRLAWKDVKPILAVLDDRFTVVFPAESVADPR